MSKDNSGRKGYRVPSIPYVGIGKRIDDLQFEHNLSAIDIERATGMDRKVIYHIKNNDNTTIKSLIVLANYFNVSLDYLVFGKE